MSLHRNYQQIIKNYPRIAQLLWS